MPIPYNYPTPTKEPAMTLREARREFNLYVRPFVEKQHPNDKVALDLAFNDWTDSLAKNGEITERQYNTWTRT